MKWVKINDFPNYEISNSGNIKNIRTGHILKPSISKRGYPVVNLYKNGKGHLKTVHLLYAKAFLPNPLKLTQINHIDGNKLNFNLSNLEWCTARENNLHARNTGLHNSNGDKKVNQYDENNVFMKTFKSISEASRITGINRSCINAVVKGNRKNKTAGGYYWRYG